jgi:uncharacterized lipoprotein YehR (DUF1307 family)
MKKGNIFNFFFGMVLIIAIAGCDSNKEAEQPVFSCEENANSIYQNSSLNNFEKSKFNKLLNEKFVLYEDLFKKAGEENNLRVGVACCDFISRISMGSLKLNLIWVLEA